MEQVALDPNAVPKPRSDMMQARENQPQHKVGSKRCNGRLHVVFMLDGP